MTARLVVPGDAPEAEWLAARRRGVTASEIAVVMGLAPPEWDSAFSLWHRKHGDLPAQPDSERLAIGRYLEAYVADRFAWHWAEFRIDGDGRALYAHPDPHRSWQLATPDRLVYDGLAYDSRADGEPIAPLECKTSATFDGWGENGTDEIPVYYRCQALWQADVLGAGAAFVACCFLPSGQLRVYELTIDGDARHDLELMRDEALSFLLRTEPPDPDWRPSTTRALKALHPDVEDRDAVIPKGLADRYHAACRSFKAAERRKSLAENLIRDRIGSAKHAIALIDGHLTTVASRTVYDLPEKTITRKACTVSKLTPAKRTKET